MFNLPLRLSILEYLKYRYVLMLFFSMSQATAFGCSCYRETNEFQLKDFDNASLVVLLEVQKHYPAVVETTWLDTIKLELETADRYGVKVVETFKGHSDSIQYLERDINSSCTGSNLLIGQTYLFFLHSKNSYPTTVGYSLCTISEVLATNVSKYPIYGKYLDSLGYSISDINRLFYIDSVNQSDKLRILRKLKNPGSDSLTVFFTGLYIQEGKILKKDSVLNFCGKYLDGKREGLWIIYSPSELKNSIYVSEVKKKSQIVERGYYLNDMKVGIWEVYFYHPNKKEWIYRKEEYISNPILSK